MIWLLAAALPLIAACALAPARTRRVAERWLIPLSPALALGLALALGGEARGHVQWLLLGAHFGFGEAGRIVLAFTALLWLIAGVYASVYFADDLRRGRFFLFFALAMSGNLGLVMAQDLASFYMFFALMTFCAYGLVVHNGDAEAYRAGRIYLVAAIFGEVLLLAAVLLAAAQMDTLMLREVRAAVAVSESRDLIVLLAFAGFGVKAGAVLVHFWMPVVYPVAPLPASAVLSGAMINAGLWGWLNFLPLGEGAFAGWSAVLVSAGLVAAFGAALIGLTQRESKAVLAYSSVSQMGVITAVLGIGLIEAESWTLVLPAVALFAVNHGLAKGALFLGLGVVARTAGTQRMLAIGALALMALAIAGAPWTGGAIVKHATHVALGIIGRDSTDPLPMLMTLSSVATALVLTHFVALVSRSEPARGNTGAACGMVAPWLVLVVCAALGVPLTAGYVGLEIDTGMRDVRDALWPIVFGVMLYLAGRRALQARAPRIPPGDIVVLLEGAVRWTGTVMAKLPRPRSAVWQLNFVHAVEELGASERSRDLSRRLELRLERWDNAALAFIAVVLALALLLWL